MCRHIIAVLISIFRQFHPATPIHNFTDPVEFWVPEDRNREQKTRYAGATGCQMTVKLRYPLWVRCQMASVVWLKSDHKSDWPAQSNDASQFLTVSSGAGRLGINKSSPCALAT